MNDACEMLQGSNALPAVIALPVPRRSLLAYLGITIHDGELVPRLLAYSVPLVHTVTAML